jgi:cytosine/creatinine deaminase
MELIIRHASIKGSKEVVDIGIDGGKIAAIVPHLDSRAAQEFEAAGKIVAPSFVEPHIHLDKALIAEDVPDVSKGTLYEGVAHTWERKKKYTVADVVARAGKVMEWAVQNGTTYMRTHADVDTIVGLKAIEGLLATKEKYANLCQLQIIAFPQEGILKDPGTAELMEEAMKMGTDIVGGMPHNEYLPEESRKHIDFCLELAKKYDADIDMHVDETDTPTSRTLQYLATRTMREGYQGRVTAGHTCALAAYDDPYAEWVIETVKKAEINMVTNPVTNLMVMGRYDKNPIRRGTTRIRELVAAGVNVAYGQDCVKDPFYPIFGTCDMLDVGVVVAHAAQFNSPQEMDILFDMPTINSAKILRLKEYGIKLGNPANLNIIDAPNVSEAFRTRPGRIVIKDGKVVAKTTITAETYW